MKTYKDIVKKEKELEKYYIENNMLTSLDINVIAHFGNIITLEMWFKNCCLFSNYNLGPLVSDVLKTIVEILDLSKEDGLRLENIKEIPVRIVLEGGSMGKVVGFGHFMKDRFVLAEDIINMAKENIEEIYAK